MRRRPRPPEAPGVAFDMLRLTQDGVTLTLSKRNIARAYSSSERYSRLALRTPSPASSYKNGTNT